MTDFVTYNGNQYDAAKLNLVKGEGSKISVTADKLANLETAQTSDKVSSLIITPFQEGFSVVAKPVGETVFPAQAHIVSKMILKKVKHDPTARFVETNVQPERPQFRQDLNRNDRPRWDNNRNAAPKSPNGGYRRNEAPAQGNFNRTPRTGVSSNQPRPLKP